MATWSDLIRSDSAQPAKDARKDVARRSAKAHFTYLLWDLRPDRTWLPQDHAAEAILGASSPRPLYLGKSAGRSRVLRHLDKDLLGCGLASPSTHAWKNPALLSYCLLKREPGWLGITFIDGEGPAADAASEDLEQVSVERLGRRRDLDLVRRQGGAATIEALLALYRPIHAAPSPFGLGVLFNQTEPRPDGRKRRFL